MKKRIKYGLLSIRNGIPMIKWIPDKDVRKTKQLFRTFYDKDISPMLVKVYPRRDIRKQVNFVDDIFCKIVPAKEEEYYVPLEKESKPEFWID